MRGADAADHRVNSKRTREAEAALGEDGGDEGDATATLKRCHKLRIAALVV